MAMPDLLYTIAAAGLSLSGLAAAARLIEWLIRTDPRLIAQTGRWAGAGVAILAAPLLLALLINEKWTAAMALAAMMLLAFSWYGPRLLQRATLAADRSSPAAGNHTFAFDTSIEDRELVRRSIAVLEQYLRRTAALPAHDTTRRVAIGMQHGAAHNGNSQDGGFGPVSRAEALDILGLGEEASEMDINDAHLRLRNLLDPKHGGSHYLTVKVDQARSLLVGHRDESSEQDASSRTPKRRRRHAQ
jgi:hypothetical protein